MTPTPDMTLTPDMTPGLELGWNIPQLLDCVLVELRVELTLAG
jgi:hypothetical protein